MKRDIGVTVTRDKRVSHATTTTPHHTLFIRLRHAYAMHAPLRGEEFPCQ